MVRLAVCHVRARGWRLCRLGEEVYVFGILVSLGVGPCASEMGVSMEKERGGAGLGDPSAENGREEFVGKGAVRNTAFALKCLDPTCDNG